MAMMECAACGQAAEARAMQPCEGCGSLLCPDCAEQGAGNCPDCGGAAR